MVFFNPFTRDEPGDAETLNARFKQMEDAINARAGSFFTYSGWQSLAVDQPEISLNVPGGVIHSTLLLCAALRTDAPGQFDSVEVEFNGNSSNAYFNQYARLVSGAFNYLSPVNNEYVFVTSAANAALSDSGLYGWMKVWIEAAHVPGRKLINYESICYTTGNFHYTMGSGTTPALVTEIETMILRANSNGSFLAGSGYALYGL